MRTAEEERFVTFVAAQGPRLTRTAYLLCGDPGLAEDLAQEALTRLYLAWRRADDPYAYARRTLVHLNIDRVRARSARPERLGGARDVADGLDARDLAGAAYDPGAVGAHGVSSGGRSGPGGRTASTAPTDAAVAAHVDLVRALARLTERERSIVVLRYYGDLPEAIVAADLGVSLGTVKSTCSRALTKLRGYLAEEDSHATC